jgi:hypothetical protein
VAIGFVVDAEFRQPGAVVVYDYLEVVRSMVVISFPDLSDHGPKKPIGPNY